MVTFTVITTGLFPLNSTRTNFSRSVSLGPEDSLGIVDRISSIWRENQINIYGVITPASSILVFAAGGEKLALRVKQIASGEL